MNNKLLMKLFLTLFSSLLMTQAQQQANPFESITCDPLTLKDCNDKEKGYIRKVTNVFFTDIDFIEDEMEMLTKEITSITKELQEKKTNEKFLNEKRLWATSRMNILWKFQEVAVQGGGSEL